MVLVFIVMTILLVVQQLMRLALVDVLFILAPLAALLWILPQSQAWGRLWGRLFVGTVFAQAVQVLTLRLGFNLATGLPQLNAAGLLQPLLGIAVLALVLKVPSLMGGGAAGGNIVASLVGTAAGAAVGSGVGGGCAGHTRRGRSHCGPPVMTGSFNSGDLLGGLGRAALAVCILAAAALLVPIGLASVGFGAILGVAGGLGAPSAAGTAGQPAVSQAIPMTGLQSVSVAIAPIQSAVAAARGLIAGWSDRAPLNQYSRSNYRSDASWLTWRNVDCSAAALDWLLGAYGQRLGSLDDAIALLGHGTGISTSLGLLDARGPALASALAVRGLDSREPRASNGQLRPLGSNAELEAWLNQGPLLMDGARWFGEGHWFVGIGYDAGGVYIRDSSGWDTRYLSWSRLFGEVGFSGWVVGVAS